MSDDHIREQVLTAVVNQPTLLLMFVGSAQLLGFLYAGVMYPETEDWILAANLSVGVMFLTGGAYRIFLAKEKSERRSVEAPRIKITSTQRDMCGQFPTEQEFADAVSSLTERYGVTDGEAAYRINTGITQKLVARRYDGDVVYVTSNLEDKTVLG